METTKLSSDRIKHLYDTFVQENPWQYWYKSYLDEVERFSAMSDELLSSKDEQKKLWSARGVSGIGPGEAVNVDGAYTDPKVVNAIVDIRRTEWPSDEKKLASEIQKAYNNLLALVYPKHTKKRPLAKIARIFATLLPRHITTTFSWDSRSDVAKLLLGRPHGEYLADAVLNRAVLRSVLGQEDGLGDCIQRSMFCWWLHTHAEELFKGNDPIVGDVSLASAPEGPEDLEAISIWPINKQVKGLTPVRGYSQTLRDITNAARGGALPDDILETMANELGFQDYSPSSLRTQ